MIFEQRPNCSGNELGKYLRNEYSRQRNREFEDLMVRYLWVSNVKMARMEWRMGSI